MSLNTKTHRRVVSIIIDEKNVGLALNNKKAVGIFLIPGRGFQ
jgi:hypothetical protein